ncbi:radical SAM protein [bacterium]|nr:radical SAM protein [bacterium]
MDSYPESQQLFLCREFRGDNFNWSEIFNIKRKIRDDCRNGIYHPICSKCWELQEMETDEDDYFSQLTFSPISKCNSRCIYCYIGNHKEYYNAEEKFDMMAIIDDLQKKNYLRFNGSLRYMGGEPTLMKDFNKITDLFVNNNVPEIYLPTSGIKYSYSIEKACELIPFCNIYISIDSGTPKTYKKIKGINAYHLVLDSLYKYNKHSKNSINVVSKYIFIPKINDNTREIDLWISESQKINLSQMAPDIEYSCVFDDSKEKYLKHLFNLTNYARKKIEEAGLVFNLGVVYRKMMYEWAKKNKERLKNDTNHEIFILDITKLTAEETENILQSIIDKNTIWNKPIIKITAEKEVTDFDEFNNILYLCILFGFKIKLETDAMKKSEMIIEALKIGDIELIADTNGLYFEEYNKYKK